MNGFAWREDIREKLRPVPKISGTSTFNVPVEGNELSKSGKTKERVFRGRECVGKEGEVSILKDCVDVYLLCWWPKCFHRVWQNRGHVLLAGATLTSGCGSETFWNRLSSEWGEGREDRVAVNTDHLLGVEGRGKDKSCYLQENLRKVEMCCHFGLLFMVRFAWDLFSWRYPNLFKRNWELSTSWKQFDSVKILRKPKGWDQVKWEDRFIDYINVSLMYRVLETNNKIKSKNKKNENRMGTGYRWIIC